MKQTLFSKLFYILFTIMGLSIGSQVYSQTVVQWYTSMGDFRVQLREDLVPMTAQNFIDLSNAEFYDDLIFHRVISGFMIQDGCPNGNGYGGPGYTFDDEFHPDLRHDEPGILSMANSGPNTNGSQYFITVAATPWLDDVHAVFGKVMDGMEVVYEISEVETYSNDKPIIDVVIDSIRVVVGDPEIELTAPEAGVNWNNSANNVITWACAFIADVRIEFSSDNGATWTDVVESASANTRSYDWIAPDITSDECLIKISDLANPDIFSITEETFTLCHLELTTPYGFETYRVGTPMEIIWTSEFVGDLMVACQVEENGEWIIIEEDVPIDEQPYMWTPDVATDWFKIKVSEMAFPEVTDESEFKSFIIRLDLLSPAGGEDLEGEAEFNILWDNEIGNNVKIEFSSDNGENWSTIEGSVSAIEEEYLWAIPNIASEECFIRLSPPDQAELFTINLTAFAISEAQGIDDRLTTFDVKLLPNPAQEVLYINVNSFSEENEIHTLEIYNTNGQLMLTKRLKNNISSEEKITVDIELLPQGMYLLEIKGARSSVIKSFVKLGN